MRRTYSGREVVKALRRRGFVVDHQRRLLKERPLPWKRYLKKDKEVPHPGHLT